MLDNLPTTGPKYNENAIVNLDRMSGRGTHWVSYSKSGHSVNYFDSFGDLPPPNELVNYFHKGPHPTYKIEYNYDRQQKFNTVWCGHLCLKFLLHHNQKYNQEENIGDG